MDKVTAKGIIKRFEKIMNMKEDDYLIVHEVADCYETSRKLINHAMMNYREELTSDGAEVLRYGKMKKFKREANEDDYDPAVYSSFSSMYSLTVFPRKAVIRLGMVTKKSEVATLVRNYMSSIEAGMDAEDKRELVVEIIENFIDKVNGVTE